MRLKSDYKILEVNPDTTDAEIKKAYRKMATKYQNTDFVPVILEVKVLVRSLESVQDL